MNNALIKNFCIYALGSIMTVFFGLVIMYMLTPSEYGLFNLAYSFINILAAIVGLGLRQVMNIEYFYRDYTGRIILINHIILLYLLCGAPLFIMLFWGIPFIKQFFFVGQAGTGLIVVSLLVVFFRFFTELFYQLLRVQCKAIALFCMQLINMVCTLLGALVFIYWLSLGAFGALISYLIGLLVVVARAFWLYADKVGFNDLSVQDAVNKMKYYMVLGFPFIPGVLFDWVLSSGDVWMLSYYIDLHHVGIYSIADNLGKIYNMFVLYPMSGSYLPLLFHEFAKNRNNFVIVERRNTRYMWIAMGIMSLLITIGLWVFSPLLLFVLPSKYHESLPFLWFIFIRYVFLMGTYFASALIQFQKRTYFLACALCFAAIVNIILNFILIPHYALYGCASATLIAYVAYFGIVLAYNYYLRSRISEPGLFERG